METSPEIKNIAKALKDFQASGIKVAKDSINPHFNSKFASLENTIDTTRDTLAKCGLSFAQFPDGAGLTTILMHESGEWIKSTGDLSADKQTPQAQGSAITYMRRYALSAALGLATEDDDDGNGASATKTTEKAPQKPVDPDLKDKRAIVALLKELGQKVDTAQAIKDAVAKLTQLPLVKESYVEIIDRLAALKDEKNAQ